jgi:hypothetical protein
MSFPSRSTDIVLFRSIDSHPVWVLFSTARAFHLEEPIEIFSKGLNCTEKNGSALLRLSLDQELRRASAQNSFESRKGGQLTISQSFESSLDRDLEFLQRVQVEETIVNLTVLEAPMRVTYNHCWRFEIKRSWFTLLLLCPFTCSLPAIHITQCMTGERSGTDFRLGRLRFIRLPPTSISLPLEKSKTDSTTCESVWSGSRHSY